MMRKIAVIGAPSSAGAYAPGQEKAPQALRDAGLIELLNERGADCIDLGDVPGFRWQPDRANPRAMHASEVARIAREVAGLVRRAAELDRIALILGGDCTVELGTVAGLIARAPDLGLIYVDLDADLQTPDTTTDGALDWMGVAHMLDLPGSISEVAGLGPRRPMLRPDTVHLFGTRNIEPPEQRRIDDLAITMTLADSVTEDPDSAARRALAWAERFPTLLIHFDVDAIDFEDFPIAENIRRKAGLRFDQVMAALDVLLTAPNLAVLTVCEVNPDHGSADGSTIRTFAQRLAGALAPTLAVQGRDPNLAGTCP